MAEFEIVDDFTYEICLLPKEKAFGFCDYLNSIGLRAKVKEKFSGHFALYATNAIDAAKAKRELLKYADSPYDRGFTRASWEKGATMKKEREVKSFFYLPFALNLRSVTTVVEILCVALYLISLFDEAFVVDTFALSRQEKFYNVIHYYKLLSAAFVHFGILHIAFNLVMFEALARPIEKITGSVKLFTLVVSIALLSNTLQYCFMPSEYGYFGGLSGVVYGVIGYCGVMAYNTNSSIGYVAPRGLLSVSVIFILFGFLIDGMANFCHLGGLIVGGLWGLYELNRKRA